MWPFRRWKRPALPLPADQLRAIDAQIAAILDRFEYDYLYFNINTFMDALLAGRTKPFRLLFQPLHSDIYGLWVGFEHADYIVVNNALVRDLMRHTALHELGHLVLEHRGLDERALEAFQQLSLMRQHAGSAIGSHLREPGDALSQNPREVAAERFAFAVNTRIERAQFEWNYYGAKSSSDAQFNQFTDVLEPRKWR